MTGCFRRGSLKIAIDSCAQLYPQKMCTTFLDNWLIRAVETGGVECAIEIGFCGFDSMRAGHVQRGIPAVFF